jgi:hypothetical protein
MTECLLTLDKLHSGDRPKEENGGDGKGMNREPSNRKNWIRRGLIWSVARHDWLIRVINLLCL